jgi:hypothetical protein
MGARRHHWCPGGSARRARGRFWRRPASPSTTAAPPPPFSIWLDRVLSLSPKRLPNVSCSWGLGSLDHCRERTRPDHTVGPLQTDIEPAPRVVEPNSAAGGAKSSRHSRPADFGVMRVRCCTLRAPTARIRCPSPSLAVSRPPSMTGQDPVGTMNGSSSCIEECSTDLVSRHQQRNSSPRGAARSPATTRRRSQAMVEVLVGAPYVIDRPILGR